MKLRVEWMKPVRLKESKLNGQRYVVDLEALPQGGGIYIFARRFGKKFEALYVGKAKSIRGRVRHHLNSLRLMDHIKGAKNGSRYVIPGVVLTKQGQNSDKARKVLERAYIRHFMVEGHDLANFQGTKMKRHHIEASGALPKSFMPGEMYVEKAKNE